MIAGSSDGVDGRRRARQGARRQEGHGAAGVAARSTHPSWRPPATGCARRSPAADLRDAEMPVVSNVDAKPHDQGGRVGRAAVGPARRSPVRWKQCLQTLVTLGVTEFAELGPGGVLTGMAKRTRRRRPHDLGRHAGRPRQAARVGRAGATPRPRSHPSRASTCSRSSASSSAPAAGVFTPVADRDGRS